MEPQRAALSRIEARWAIAQSGVAEMHTVLAYAEAFAVIAAGVSVTVDPPERLVRRMVEETVRGDKRWLPAAHTFPIHLCKSTRLEVASRLALHARIRGRAVPLWEARLGPAQLGDLRGIEQLAHWAGEMMTFVRSGDGVVLEAAVKLADFVRGRLEPWAGDPDDEDTARLSAPCALPPVVTSPDGPPPDGPPTDAAGANGPARQSQVPCTTSEKTRPGR